MAVLFGVYVYVAACSSPRSARRCPKKSAPRSRGREVRLLRAGMLPLASSSS
jgi:hypothetical protein